MPQKHPATSPAMSPSVAKKKRKTLPHEVKLDIIHRHDRGKKTNSIARYHGLTPSTVSTIFKSVDSIKRLVRPYLPSKLKEPPELVILQWIK
ncbi:hypothetical protein E2C01_028370 [Portunus trituberculatus]|uniref:HTH psq-type domain-containing protein n=1 Tax=Portunus trituberculatus TaxID=210409 RepID=A0A5B7ENG2_PORTR|nr:hypothetical protein [Portunus trituberculatus]